jgi:hypothetical protein
MARRPDLTALPFWPRFLSREEAARYLGVPQTTFEEEVKAGFWPAGRARGARGIRLTWDRVMLDLAADRDAGLSNAQQAPPPAPDVRSAWRARLDGQAAQQSHQTGPQAARGR